MHVLLSVSIASLLGFNYLTSTEYCGNKYKNDLQILSSDFVMHPDQSNKNIEYNKMFKRMDSKKYEEYRDNYQEIRHDFRIHMQPPT